MINNVCFKCKHEWQSSEPMFTCPECGSDMVMSAEIKMQETEND